MDEFLEYGARKGNKKGSIDTKRYQLQALLDLDIELERLTKDVAQHLYDEMVDDEYSADYHRAALSSAKQCIAFAIKRGYVKSNPFDVVDPVGQKNHGKEQLRIDEARTFAAHCLAAWNNRKDRSGIAAILPLYLTLRASEVSQLLNVDVDDDGRLLWIAEHTSKSKKSRRRALLPAFLQQPLRDLAAEPACANGALFANERGAQADRHWVSRIVRQHMDDAGVRVLTTHSLRGLHTTLATVQGATAQAVADAMGHESVSTTKRAYIDGEVAGAAELERAWAVLAPTVTASSQPSPASDDPSSTASDRAAVRETEAPESLGSNQTRLDPSPNTTPKDDT